jgi:hypothetical protein
MRDVTSAPLFIRLGARMRCPSSAVRPGSLRRISISNVNCYNAVSKYGCIISGIPENAIEDVRLSHIYLHHQGGGTAAQAALDPKEEEAKYPDPRMFGDMPTQGFFVRHVKNLEMTDIHLLAAAPDERPGFKFRDVDGLDLFRIHAEAGSNSAKVILDHVKKCKIARFTGIKDVTLDNVDHKVLGYRKDE